MTAYLLAFVQVHDERRYRSEYVAHMQASLDPFGGRYLALRSAAATAEGALPAGSVVLISFPNMTQARAWYASRPYAALIDVRRVTAETNLCFFAGVDEQESAEE